MARWHEGRNGRNGTKAGMTGRHEGRNANDRQKKEEAFYLTSPIYSMQLNVVFVKNFLSIIKI
jgi:hypothetical protein